MKFSGGEMVFYSLKIRSKATNVAEINRKVLEEVSRHPRSSAEGQSNLVTCVVPSLDGDCKAGRSEAIIKKILNS